MLFKKKKTATESAKVILGMIMLRDNRSFEIDRFSTNLRLNYGLDISAAKGNSSSYVFTLDGERIIIGHVSAPIPFADIEEAAQYAYNWRNVLQDTEEHKSHLIVSSIGESQDQVKRFLTFSKAIYSLILASNAIGVYKGSQSLLIPKDDYLIECDSMSDDDLPLNLWIYFGLRNGECGNSGYSYGLKEFNKEEMEIVNSTKTLAEIRSFLYNMAHYV